MRQSPFFQKWTSRDWLLNLLVYAHNTKVALKAQDIADFTVKPDNICVSTETLAALLRYVSISDAVYAPSQSQFCKEACVYQNQIVRIHPGGVLSPKVILLLDHSNAEIIVAVRGSASILDFCTDICLFNEPFQDGYGHRGIVHASLWLLGHFKRDIHQLHQQYPEYAIVFTGHSLGAGVACMTAIELHQQSSEALRKKLKCFVFATPACATHSIAQYCRKFVTSVVYGDDCVPRLHGQSFEQLEKELSRFDWRSSLRQAILKELEEKRDQVQCQITATMEERKLTIRKKRDEGLDQVAQFVKRLEEPTKAFKASKMAQAGMNITSQFTDQMSDQWQKTLQYFRIQPVDRKRLAAVKQTLVEKYKLQDAWNHTELETKRLLSKVSDASNDLINANQPLDFLYERIHHLYNISRSPPLTNGSIAPAETAPTMDTQTKSQSPLVIPGRVLYLRRRQTQETRAITSDYVLEDATTDEFQNIIFSESMITDHLCSSYKQVLSNMFTKSKESSSD